MQNQLEYLAPILNEQIYSFYGDVIKIKYLPNPMVKEENKYNFALKIYDGLGKLLNKNIIVSNSREIEKNLITFYPFEVIERDKLKVGWYYKFQIAYYDGVNETVGPYTAFYTLKYTVEPSVNVNYDYLYNKIIIDYNTDAADRTEYLKSFQIETYKDSGYTQLLEKSGVIENSNSYYCKKRIEDTNDRLYVKVFVESVNGIKLIETSQFYIKHQTNQIDGICDISIDDENGINFISINNITNDLLSDLILFRVNEKELPDWNWQKIKTLPSLQSGQSLIYYDTGIESGNKYYYKLERSVSNYYEVLFIDNEGSINNFEYIFLSDDDKQLCLKFNADISSYKEIIQETKIETLGGKYPKFFRNGYVSYKELPIQGLISYWCDKKNYFANRIIFTEEKRNNTSALQEQKLATYLVDKTNRTIRDKTQNVFLATPHLQSEETDQDYKNRHTATINLTSSNYRNEREFKNEVLQWLNNGKAKLLRTDAEGNFIVRLMNVSMTPDKVTRRLIHNISATAYEIADYTQENLELNNVLFNSQGVIV